MRKPCFYLGSSSLLQKTGSETDDGIENDRLWARVIDYDTHLFLREPAIRELAQRRDNRIVDFCETLLESEDPDEFLVAIDTLARLGGNYAVNRLAGLFSQCPAHDRMIVLSRLAQVVTSG